MSDLISRQVAIEALAENMPQPYTPDGSHPADEGIFMAQEIYADCIQTLKELPSAQPQWIPISKTLPKKDGLYLCWYEYYHWSKEKVLPEYGIGYYDSGFNFWGGEVAQGRNAKVLAWMPLPDPYKGEQNE